MSNSICIYWLQAITPLHIGSGKGMGFIDMPIMREKVTNWPLVPGSALKGVIRDHFEQNGNEKQKNMVNIAFGKREIDESSNAGSLVLTDAHMIFLPVRSLYGTFAYVTSPLVLYRLCRDLKLAGFKEEPVPSPENGEVLLTEGSKLSVEGQVYFEDLDFKAKVDEATGKWADILCKAIFPGDAIWRGILRERLAIVSDDSFNFISETGTEVTAHIRIEDDTKIVAKHALWYEEALPAETILAGIAWCDRIFGDKTVKESEIMDSFCPTEGLDLQIGGKATVGKGRIRCTFSRS